MNKKLPTLISYQGGSAGDLFTASLNGIVLDFTNKLTAQNHSYTIKNHQVRSPADIVQAIANCNYDYVSTHDFDLLLDSQLDWINVTVVDPGTQNLCILRQMSLQILHIKVDQSSDWYRVVRGMCMNNRFESAAGYWLAQARRLWLDQMQNRTQHRHRAAKTVSFDQLFEQDFAQQIQRQGIDSPALHNNHRAWLAKNSKQRWNQSATIESMAQKLRAMNWQQTSGWVRYGA